MEEREYRNRLYAARKKANECVRCGKQDAYTLAGRSHCYECAEYMREYGKKRDRKKQNEQAKARNEAWASKGLCVRCGKPVPTGRRVCAHCNEQNAKRTRERKIAAGMNWPRGDNGYCFICNKRKAIPGKKLCEVCYENTLAAQKKATEWHKENGNGILKDTIHGFFVLEHEQAKERKSKKMNTGNMREA